MAALVDASRRTCRWCVLQRHSILAEDSTEDILPRDQQLCERCDLEARARLVLRIRRWPGPGQDRQVFGHSVQFHDLGKTLLPF